TLDAAARPIAAAKQMKSPTRGREARSLLPSKPAKTPRAVRNSQQNSWRTFLFAFRDHPLQAIQFFGRKLRDFPAKKSRSRAFRLAFEKGIHKVSKCGPPR